MLPVTFNPKLNYHYYFWNRANCHSNGVIILSVALAFVFISSIILPGKNLALIKIAFKMQNCDLAYSNI